MKGRHDLGHVEQTRVDRRSAGRGYRGRSPALGDRARGSRHDRVVAFLPRAVKSDPSPPGTTGALVWGDGVFANKLELEAWLRIRGVSYESWARKHPAAVKLLEKQ